MLREVLTTALLVGARCATRPRATRRLEQLARGDAEAAGDRTIVSSCGSRPPRSRREISAESICAASESRSAASCPQRAVDGAGSPRTEPSVPRARMLSARRARHQGQNLKSLLIEQFSAHGVTDKLRAVVRVELDQEVLVVGADGRGGDLEPAGDLRGAEPVGHG